MNNIVQQERRKTDTIFDAVFDFNERVIGTPAVVALNTLTEKQFDWTIKFCQEELTEFTEAYKRQDIVMMVDGVLDLVYGALGTLKKMGLTREQAYACMTAIHTANMTKEKGVVAHRGSDEDAAKPANFVPPDETIGVILFGDDRQIGD